MDYVKKGEYIDFNHILGSLPYCMHRHQTFWSSLSIRLTDLFIQFIKNTELTLENYDCGKFYAVGVNAKRIIKKNTTSLFLH